jgi:hypothetical protein
MLCGQSAQPPGSRAPANRVETVFIRGDTGLIASIRGR